MVCANFVYILYEHVFDVYIFLCTYSVHHLIVHKFEVCANFVFMLSVHVFEVCFYFMNILCVQYKCTRVAAVYIFCVQIKCTRITVYIKSQCKNVIYIQNTRLLLGWKLADGLLAGRSSPKFQRFPGLLARDLHFDGQDVPSWRRKTSEMAENGENRER